MPLLCISLLVLVLLPLSLSCDRKTPAEVRDRFSETVETYMSNTRENLTSENHSCDKVKHKPPNCTTENPDIVGTLLLQACEMMGLRLPQTKALATVVQDSIDCPCPKGSTKGVRPSMRPTRRRTTGSREEKRKKKICKANAILSSMTVCYQKLNSQLMDA
ncbi:uncharacterized protein V3H82_021675 [Fundulus diaphanus]